LEQEHRIHPGNTTSDELPVNSKITVTSFFRSPFNKLAFSLISMAKHGNKASKQKQKCILVFLWSPYGIGQTIIFSSCDFFFLPFFLLFFLA